MRYVKLPENIISQLNKLKILTAVSEDIRKSLEEYFQDNIPYFYCFDKFHESKDWMKDGLPPVFRIKFYDYNGKHGILTIDDDGNSYSYLSE